jgi:hypothetical protein
VNWFQVFGIAVEVGEAALQDAAAIEADQAASSPPVFVTLDGHKYQAVLQLTPVAS